MDINKYQSDFLLSNTEKYQATLFVPYIVDNCTISVVFPVTIMVLQSATFQNTVSTGCIGKLYWFECFTW